MTQDQDKLEQDAKLEAEKQVKKRRSSVVTYLIIMLVAVLLLLAMSYVMQQRNTQSINNLTQTVSGLQDSYSALDTINSLQAQIDTLNAKIASLEKSNEANQAELDSLKESSSQLQEQLTAATTQSQENRALAWYYCIANAEEADQDALIEAFEATGLAQYLPEAPLTEGLPSPVQDYAAIVAKRQAAAGQVPTAPSGSGQD